MSQKDVQEAIEKIEEVLEESGEFISTCYEYQTRYALIDPILTSLGWVISDVDQVQVEYQTDWGRIDYALLEHADGDPAIAVEAKTLWTNLESTTIQRQILSYAEGRRKGYLVLTDGETWQIFDLGKRGKFQNKLVEHISVGDSSAASIAKTLNQMLRKNLHWKS